MRKLEEGQADATFLAMAGLRRLGYDHMATPIPVTDMLPAAAQGIIGVVCRDDADEELRAVLAKLNVAVSEAAATAERTFLAVLDGSCRTPIAAHLFDDGAHWRLDGEVLSPKGDQRWTATGKASKSAKMAQLAELGRTVAHGILESAEGKLPAFGAE